MKILKHLPTAFLTLLLASPLCVLLLAWSAEDHSDTFSYIVEKQLPEYAANSLILLVSTLLITGLMGCVTAWCVSRYQLRFRRWLDIGLMLPLAMPSYLSAMVYGRLLDEAGIVQRYIDGQWVPNIYSLGGLIFILSLSLFPYVYMAMRLAFMKDTQRLIEAAQMLGVREGSLLWRIAIPAACPALIAGLSLVAMETLAEFGASSLYGVQTFTTGIYSAWYQQFNPIAAAKLASLLVVIVLVILWLEKRLRNKAHYQMGQGHVSATESRIALTCMKQIAATFFCAIPAFFGFIIPLMQLLTWSQLSRDSFFNAQSISALKGSLMVAFYVAIFALAIALFYAYLQRAFPKQRIAQFAARIATLGYAIPGTVIAVALFIPLISLDRFIANLGQGETLPMLFTGSIAAMVIACVIRFLAVAFSAVEPALAMIPPRHDEAAKMLGANRRSIIKKVHLPMMKPAMSMGFLLVMVDTIKELPASLMLRPFDQSTLAIRSYELAVDGRLIAASQPALLVVLVGSVVILALHSLGLYTHSQSKASS